jgi:hypothetical protein
VENKIHFLGYHKIFKLKIFSEGWALKIDPKQKFSNSHNRWLKICFLIEIDWNILLWSLDGKKYIRKKYFRKDDKINKKSYARGIYWEDFMVDFKFLSMDFMDFKRFQGLHWISLVFIGVHWCSLVFIGVHWCSLDFIRFLYPKITNHPEISNIEPYQSLI